MPKPKVFLVQSRAGTVQDAPKRLIRGTRSSVESFLISELSIEAVTAEQAVELGAAGVKVESTA